MKMTVTDYRFTQYTNGELDPDEMNEFFQELIDCELVWELCGLFYGTVARELIKHGLCRPKDRGGEENAG